MWLTSKRPARVRTAVCSATTPPPEYSTGMSQPPNGTIFAPEARWRVLSGVFLSGGSVACSMWGARSGPEQVTVLCAFGRGQELTRWQCGCKPNDKELNREDDIDPDAERRTPWD